MEDGWLINPDSPWVQKWDVVIIVCLICTGFVTPYEVHTQPNALARFVHTTCAPLLPGPQVAVLDSQPSVFCEFHLSMGLLFLANRIVDLVFMVDMGFMFFMAYRADDVRHEGLYVSRMSASTSIPAASVTPSTHPIR